MIAISIAVHGLSPSGALDDLRAAELVGRRTTGGAQKKFPPLPGWQEGKVAVAPAGVS